MSVYLELFEAPTAHRIELIRAGVRLSEVKKLARALGLPQPAFLKALGIRRTTAKSNRFTSASSERLIGLMALIGQIEAMVPSMDPNIDFDAGKWLGAWLCTPVPALGGARPDTYLNTIAGRGLLGSLIATAQSGAFT